MEKYFGHELLDFVVFGQDMVFGLSHRACATIIGGTNVLVMVASSIALGHVMLDSALAYV